jgi:hypothetical protein
MDMRRCQFRRYAVLAAIVLWAFAMAACEQKTINQIKADPGRYANSDVAVVGNVTRSVSVLGRGAYEIDDGTGKLCVVSDKGVPREGAQIAVKGKIREAYNLNAFIKLPDQISSGMVMIESSHKEK